MGLLAAACGGRTGNGLDDGFGTSPGGAPNGAAAGDPGFGGAAGDGSGGQGGTGARGAGGRRGNGGAGGYGTGGYGYGGYAAYPGSGGYGYGGYGAYSGYGGYSYGGYGAYPGYGGYSYGGYGAYGGYGYGGYGYAGSPTPYCQFPSCGSCPDCVSNCLCYGNDPNSCYASCGYGSGGSVGTGGSPSCGPGVCPQAVIPNVGIGLSGCCLSDGTCGVSTDVIASIINVQGGCQAYNQFGTYDGQCAPEPSPVGPPLAGCCRPDGTCGNDLGMLGLGCVQAQRGGSVTFCAGLPMGAGGSATGTGGSTSADQCVANAQSDCERCACKTCNGNLGACFQDAGCPLILQCANQTGCTGVNCYQPSTCQAVIDQFGGIGSTSVSLAIPLFQCASGCGCGFAHP